MTTFAPYAPPSAPPEKPEASGHPWNRVLAAVMWAIAIATVAVARYALASTTAMP
jgi:hypothetical protein